MSAFNLEVSGLTREKKAANIQWIGSTRNNPLPSPSQPSRQGPKLSGTTGQTASRFVFEISEDDDRIFRKTITRDLKLYLDRRIIRGVPLLIFFALAGALAVAMQRGYVSFAVVMTFEPSFFIGYLAPAIAALIAVPRMQRALFRDIPAVNRRFDLAFDDDGVVVKIGLKETAMPWAAIARVEDIQ